MTDTTSAGRLIYEEAKAAHEGTDTIIAMLSEDEGDGESPLTRLVELLETIAAGQVTILQEIAALRGEVRTASPPPA